MEGIDYIKSNLNLEIPKSLKSITFGNLGTVKFDNLDLDKIDISARGNVTVMIKNLLYKFICILLIFTLSMNYVTFAKSTNTNTISNEYVYKLIKQQSKESLNSIEWLSYKLVDLDNDNNFASMTETYYF